MIRKVLLALMFFLPLARADDVEALQREVGSMASRLESMAKAVKDGKSLSPSELEELARILDAVSKRDIALDAEGVIEDLKKGDTEYARQGAEDILQFLRSLRQDLQKPQGPQDDPLAEILEEQQALRKELEKLAEQMKDQKDQKPDEKTLEHLAEKQAKIQEALKKAAEKVGKESESAEAMMKGVDQLDKVRKMIERGEIDSGIWESKKVEEQLAELIKKKLYEDNPYAMQQRLIVLSDFIEFLQELGSRQQLEFETWDRFRSRSMNDNKFRVRTREQAAIASFSHERDQALAMAGSMAYVYGMTDLQKSLDGFVAELKSQKFPEVQAAERWTRDLQALVNGLKDLKGSLKQEMRRLPQRESHAGEDVNAPLVSAIDELRYLRQLQFQLGQDAKAYPHDESIRKRQEDILFILLKLKSRL
ncbi:MAG: hypothetical protein AB7F75_11740, partial [Planctomycetota bacterium]